MFVHHRTLGIILKKEDRGEANQVFTILTKDFGKLRILGKAIRKIKSKLRAGTQKFYLSEVEFIQGKTYKTLTDAIPIEKFQNIKKDLDRLKVAYEIAEILDNLIKGEELDKDIWELILETFRKLNDCFLSPASFFLIYHYFLWNFFSILGCEPELKNCALCQKKLVPDDLFFNSEQGGIICSNCFKETKVGKKINPEIIKILRVLLKKDWKILFKLKLGSNQRKDLKMISEDYLSYLSSILGLS